jgi:hypothetical protein
MKLRDTQNLHKGRIPTTPITNPYNHSITKTIT